MMVSVKSSVRFVSTLAVCAGLAGAVMAARPRPDVSATLDVDVSKPGTTIPGTFFGLMTEEINHAYDGGLYAELIQNRTFQDGQNRGGGTPVHWSVVGQGTVSTDRTNPVNAALPVSLRLDISGGEGGVANDGYWGIPVRPDTPYTASFYAKATGYSGPVTASIRTDDRTTVASAATSPISGGWQKYTVKLRTAASAPTTSAAKFVLSSTGSGRIWFSNVSLFPPTYQNAANGLRPDLMELMAAMKPKFIRLPGGNYVEGGRFSDRFNWKQMIGPVDQRPGHMGCWSYRSSDGFGMPEYLLWCKQLGAEPVLAVFAGYVLNGDHFAPGSKEMEIYTQEALDEIEYVSGPATSTWGRKRAADGFPQPFPLHYVEIGNEDWFDRSGSYDGRFAQMATAIRKRYPRLKIIATAPVTTVKPDLYDDHFYRSPRQLLSMATMYDNPAPATLRFDGGGYNGRQSGGLKTFVGEWAAQEGRPTPTLNSALADAAFVMGMEKNSDAVVMECYAPLFVNVSPADPAKGYPRGWQWNTNLIGYDALHSFGSPSYYAQVMLAQNSGDTVLPAKLGAPPAQVKLETPHGGIGVGSWHTQVEYTDIRVTAPDGHKLFTADFNGDASSWEAAGGPWRTRDNAIRPASRDAETWAVTGDRSWTDYTVNLRARKLGGQEGFLILWHATDTDNYRWWNIGGWGNTQTRCEVAEAGGRNAYGRGSSFTVDTGKWYDLKLEVSGPRMRGYVDGKLMTEAVYEPQATSSRDIFATATLDKAAGTVIVKVLNYGGDPVDMAINLHGVSRVDPNGTAIVLAGAPGDVNSVEEPRKVAPRRETITNAGTSFHRTFAPHSLTILRLKSAAR